MIRKGMKPWEQLPWVGRPMGWAMIQVVLAVFCVGLGVKICLTITDAPYVASELE